MAYFSNAKTIAAGSITAVDSSKTDVLGQRRKDEVGNEYIYLAGAASTAAGKWVTFDESFATTLLTANAVGPVAIAMSAVDSTSKYGWYQIYGVNTIASTDTVAADKQLYIDGTAGRADDANVAGDLILGAYSLTADTTNVATVHISYPTVTDVLGA